jgi:hypothetical protein
MWSPPPDGSALQGGERVRRALLLQPGGLACGVMGAVEVARNGRQWPSSSAPIHLNNRRKLLLAPSPAHWLLQLPMFDRRRQQLRQKLDKVTPIGTLAPSRSEPAGPPKCLAKARRMSAAQPPRFRYWIICERTIGGQLDASAAGAGVVCTGSRWCKKIVTLFSRPGQRLGRSPGESGSSLVRAWAVCPSYEMITMAINRRVAKIAKLPGQSSVQRKAPRRVVR